MAGSKYTAPTTKHLKNLAPSFVRQLGARYEERPDLLLAAWPSVIGSRFASMTKAVSFVDGILTIKVKNSSLLSLLAQHERLRLCKELRKKFPKAALRDIRFVIG
jgi:hypothetical protein